MSKVYNKQPKVEVGDKFYYLEVIAPPFYETYPSGRKRKKLLCRCICGKEQTFIYDGFFCKDEKERTKSCGCKHIYRNNLNSQARRKPESVYRYIYERYKFGAKTRNISFNLSKKEFIDIVKKNCYYCGIEPPIKQPHKGKNRYIGVPVPYHGIDRVDSSKSYQIQNCVSCCTRCNYMKRDMEISTFTEHILKISNNLHKTLN
jgi:hypothetical protein